MIQTLRVILFKKLKNSRNSFGNCKVIFRKASPGGITNGGYKKAALIY